MSLNAHAFVEGDYMGTLYRAAERLSDEDLEERIGMYEERQKALDKKYSQGSCISKASHWATESPTGFALGFVTLTAFWWPFIGAGLAEAAYEKLTENKPLILDNVNPLINPEDAYKAAVEVRDFRRKQF